MGQTKSETEETVQEEFEDFDSAFEAAVEKHSPGGVTTEEEEAAAAADTGEETQADDTQTVEESTEEETSPEESEKAADQEQETAESELSDEEFERLQKKDPKALFENLKNFRTSLTQKSQDIAAQKQQYEEGLTAVSQVKDLILAYNADPKATVLQLAKQVGLKLADGSAGTVSSKETSESAASEAVHEVLPELEELLGADVAKVVLPALTKIAELAAESKVKPVLDYQQALSQKEQQVAIDNVLKGLDTSRPQWRNHHDKMLQVMKEVRPAPGAPLNNYLERVYDIATAGLTNPSETKKVLNRIKQSAKASDSASGGVASTKVSPKVTPEDVNDFDHAFALAEKGIRVGE